MHRHQDRLGLCFALVCGAFFFIIIFTGGPQKEVQVGQSASEEYTRESFLELFVRLYGESRQLDTLCYDRTTFVEIRDEIVEVNGRKEIRRAAKKGMNLMTYAYLKFPDKLTSANTDTSKWKIDVYRKPPRSQGGIVDELFASGAIPPTPKSNARLLTIGLGGGFLNNYLHHAFPQMSITAVEIHRPTLEMAKKWFSLEPDNLLRVIIEDGAVYLKESVREGRRYDAIVLDACFIRTHEEILCPHKVFLDPHTIEDMAELVGKQGVLIVNILPISGYPHSVVEKVKQKFLVSFRYSKVKRIEGTMNFIATFTQFEHKELYALLDKAFSMPFNTTG
ncbi:hypothetical protein GCK32_001188 [Trichostrongylus colubriformis]|uniref:Uncharacterized protein n=1 Tax=Trichostrongylus colubriformis TaxID=6319 RepID=A0AAN8IRE4_TRICO